MDALQHFDQLYGDLGLSPQDAAKWVFVSGWNSAMQEAMQRVQTMQLQDDTKASFSVYFQQMMHIDPATIQARMQ
jgi:hypothetical protein